MLPSTFEDYLEAVLTVTEDNGRPATLKEIAAALGTRTEIARANAVSLTGEGYLEQVSDDTVRLTAKGSEVASRVARKHRVLQCFLTEMLGVDEAAASKEACTLEHDISDETIERLSSYMDSAQSPPECIGRCRGGEACTLEHGISDDTIEQPSSSMDGTRSPPVHPGRCRAPGVCTLLDCKEGDTVRVAMIRRPRRNRRLLDLGIFPGETLKIRRKLQNESVVVRVKGCDIAISPEIAASILVESCP